MATNQQPTASRFYKPCLQVLQQNAPTPMGVAEIIEAVLQANAVNDFHSSNSGVRAILIKMAACDQSPILMEAGSQPPKFYVAKKLQASPQDKIVVTSSCKVTKKPPKSCNSIFYEPACKILKANAPTPMSASEMMKAIIEQYPNLEWSHSQGPIRAMLLSAAKLEHTPIRQVPDVLPPMFFYQETVGSKEVEAPEASAEEIMGNAFAQTQATLKAKLLKKIMELDWLAFEHLANRLVSKIMFGEAMDTPGSGDGGIDGYINIYADPLGLNTIGVQAKHYTAGENVQRPEIQQFIGALHGKNGVFISSSDFSKTAKEEAQHSTPSTIRLINGQQMVDFMLQYKVGVRDTGISYTLAEIDEAFFEEL